MNKITYIFVCILVCTAFIVGFAEGDSGKFVAHSPFDPMLTGGQIPDEAASTSTEP